MAVHSVVPSQCCDPFTPSNLPLQCAMSAFFWCWIVPVYKSTFMSHVTCPILTLSPHVISILPSLSVTAFSFSLVSHPLLSFFSSPLIAPFLFSPFSKISFFTFSLILCSFFLSLVILTSPSFTALEKKGRDAR